MVGIAKNPRTSSLSYFTCHFFVIEEELVKVLVNFRKDDDKKQFPAMNKKSLNEIMFACVYVVAGI
ncbi:hypothetical protein [Evansella halocellulosilytica]|uniref:hypothetical protein n=1 Tax=Evansella halocellulosilytica TaxID=2011013 RepID=UPI000BB7339D|nr:hypothetical protein [Evansella halocellulosilytica]